MSDGSFFARMILKISCNKRYNCQNSSFSSIILRPTPGAAIDGTDQRIIEGSDGENVATSTTEMEPMRTVELLRKLERSLDEPPEMEDDVDGEEDDVTDHTDVTREQRAREACTKDS